MSSAALDTVAGLFGCHAQTQNLFQSMADVDSRFLVSSELL